MKITTFETTTEGGSRFREMDIEFDVSHEDEFGHTIRCTSPYTSPGVQFVVLPDGMDQGWHNAPARQIVVVLAGVIEVETTDGQRRQWRTGEVFLPADVDGQGHCTRSIGGPVSLLFAPLNAGFEFSSPH